MALSFSRTDVNIKQAGGRKLKLVAITLDAVYVNGTGYTVNASDVKLTKIESAIFGNVPGYQLSASGTLPGTSVTMKAWKGNTEASNNEAGLNGLVTLAQIWGY